MTTTQQVVTPIPTTTANRAELPVLLVVSAITALAVGVTWLLPALMWLTAIGVRLAFIDAATLRLPNRLVGLAYAGVTSLLLLPAAIYGAWADYAIAVIAGLSMFCVYFLLALARPGGMGMGDVKLAAPLGTMLGWFSWTTLFWGFTLGFLVGAVVGIALIRTGRADRRTKIPFGPSMLVGAWLAILLTAM